jgi:hypothetical protein
MPAPRLRGDRLREDDEEMLGIEPASRGGDRGHVEVTTGRDNSLTTFPRDCDDLTMRPTVDAWNDQPRNDDVDADGNVARSDTLPALRARWARAMAEGHAGAFHADMLAAIEKLIGNDNPAVRARGRKLLCCAMCNLGPTPESCATCAI